MMHMHMHMHSSSSPSTHSSSSIARPVCLPSILLPFLPPSSLTLFLPQPHRRPPLRRESDIILRSSLIYRPASDLFSSYHSISSFPPSLLEYLFTYIPSPSRSILLRQYNQPPTTTTFIHPVDNIEYNNTGSTIPYPHIHLAISHLPCDIITFTYIILELRHPLKIINT
jgi:hypothetical protein